MADHGIYQHLSEKKETRLQKFVCISIFSGTKRWGKKLPEQDLVA